MTKIVIVGAGSGFGSRLSVDIMSREALEDATIALCDIHPGRLAKVKGYVERTVAKYDLPTRVIASPDRRVLLPDADFVITSIAAGGGSYWGEPYRSEIEIPRKYGICQTVADTIGVGGVFRFLRTGPVQQQILRDIEELSPDAYVLNHTNPMAMLTWLHSVDSSVRNVGLCHSVQGTTQQLAGIANVDYEEVHYFVAGINHQAWVLEFRRGKEDLYPALRRALDDPQVVARDPVRFEMMRHFGAFVTESSRHNAEYLPYFVRTAGLRERFGVTPREVQMAPRRVREWQADGEGDAPPVGELRRSHEYTTGIIEAMITNLPFRFNGNVMNTGLITNLPDGCCVEVPCMVDANGVSPCYVGALPAQLAALNMSGVAVQELAVQAVLEHDREAAFWACALDPLASAILPLHEIREMFDELWAAVAPHLKWFETGFTGPVPETCAP